MWLRIFDKNARDVMPFSASYLGKWCWCFITGTVNSDHTLIVKWCFRFCHYKVVIFPLKNNEICGTSWSYALSSFTSNFYSLTLASISGSWMHQLLLWCMIMLISNFLILLHLLTSILWWKELFLLARLLVQLFIYMSMDS